MSDEPCRQRRRRKAKKGRKSAEPAIVAVDAALAVTSKPKKVDRAELRRRLRDKISAHENSRAAGASPRQRHLRDRRDRRVMNSMQAKAQEALAHRIVAASAPLTSGNEADHSSAAKIKGVSKDIRAARAFGLWLRQEVHQAHIVTVMQTIQEEYASWRAVTGDRADKLRDALKELEGAPESTPSAIEVLFGLLSTETEDHFSATQIGVMGRGDCLNVRLMNGLRAEFLSDIESRFQDSLSFDESGDYACAYFLWRNDASLDHIRAKAIYEQSELATGSAVIKTMTASGHGESKQAALSTAEESRKVGELLKAWLRTCNDDDVKLKSLLEHCSSRYGERYARWVTDGRKKELERALAKSSKVAVMELLQATERTHDWGRAGYIAHESLGRVLLTQVLLAMKMDLKSQFMASGDKSHLGSDLFELACYVDEALTGLDYASIAGALMPSAPAPALAMTGSQEEG